MACIISKVSELWRGFALSFPIQGMIALFLFSFQACQPEEEGSPLLITIDHMEYVVDGSYMVTGTLVSMGDSEISGYGICWGESENPDMDGSCIDLGSPALAGEFKVPVSGLSASTSYYFRAFALIHSLPVYSEEKIFTTRPAPEDMVMDVDGNIYKIVTVGDQIWMAENLKATMYADKSSIPLVVEKMDWFDLHRESEAYCWYDNVIANGWVYGGLYTWPAAVRGAEGSDLIPSGIQGVCPDGWHLPSDGEWKQLETYLGMSQEDADNVEWRGVDQGGKLKQEGTRLWKDPNSSATNEVEFNAIPAGYRLGSGDFYDLSISTRFWSSSGRGYGFAWFRQLDYDTASVFRDFEGVYSGYSVRCVKD